MRSPSLHVASAAATSDHRPGPDPERPLDETPAERQDLADLVHGLANHVGALLLGIDLLRGEDDLPDHATETLEALLGEVRSAAALLTRLQQLAPSPDHPTPADTTTPPDGPAA